MDDLQRWIDDTASMVDDAFACPDCGEREMDHLVWNDEWDLVECQTCGARFDPALDCLLTHGTLYDKMESESSVRDNQEEGR